MTQFIIRRTLYALITLFILSLTIFMVVRLTGDPVTLLAEPGARAEDLDRLRAEWGLDRPWPVQYLAFVKNIVHRRAGQIVQLPDAGQHAVFPAPAEFVCELALAATLISFFIGIPAGLISAVKVNSGWDNVGKIVALFGLVGPRLLARAGDDPGLLGMAATGCRPAARAAGSI